MQRDYSYLRFSSVEVLTTGSSVILPAPGTNKQYAIWGFVLDVSAVGAKEINYWTNTSAILFQVRAMDFSGTTFIGSRATMLPIPISVGNNSRLLLSIVGGGTVHCDAAVYFTVVDV